MNILQEIFTDYYEEIKYTLHPRDVEMDNIDRMINCGDPSFGGAMYVCPHCGNIKFVPGFTCVLHTFGRPLKWNPHIHCLITEGSFSDDGFWKNVKHFNYTFLRNAFQTALLDEMDLWEIYYNHRRVPLEELYERTMAKARCRSS